MLHCHQVLGTLQPIHFLKAHEVSLLRLEQKYKNRDKEKDNDEDKGAERITEKQLVCYIFVILMTQAFQV